jgi:hypothetical protein
MTAITTSVGIVNLALVHLGHNAITTIGESTKAGQLSAAVYEATRDALLRSHPWNFAIVRKSLAQDSGASATLAALEYEYDYAYTLPTNPYCLKSIRTSAEAAGLDHDYRIEGRYLLTNEATVELEYIGRVTTVTEYDALFVRLLALDLAVSMGLALTDNAALIDRLIEMRKDMNEAAMGVDAQEGKPRETVDATGWINARL